MDVIETIFEIIKFQTQGNNLDVMRILRVLRITRAIRVIRLVRAFKSLRMMILSILRSGMLLIWSMVLLTIIIYVFGIYLMQSVTYYIHESDEGTNLTKMKEMF